MRASWATVALVMLLAHGAAVAQPDVRQALSAFKENLSTRCEMLKPREPVPVELDPLVPVREAVCSCLPGEVDRLAASAQGLSAETVEPQLKLAMGRCTATALRQWMPLACEKDTTLGITPERRTAYCGCITQGLTAMSDEAIVQSAMEASTRFQRKAAARAASQPAPVEEPTPMDRMEVSCRGRLAPVEGSAPR